MADPPFRPGYRRAAGGGRDLTRPQVSKLLEQTFEIIPLDRRARGLADAAAQFVKDLARLVDRALVRDLDVALVIGAVIGDRTRERVARRAARKRPPIPVPRLSPETALHLARELASGLLQLVERLGLRIDRGARHVIAQRFDRFAHRPLGPSERVGNLAPASAEALH